MQLFGSVKVHIFLHLNVNVFVTSELIHNLGSFEKGIQLRIYGENLW